MIPNPYSGAFFAFEGPNGSGKSYIMDKVLQKMRSYEAFRPMKKAPIGLSGNLVVTNPASLGVQIVTTKEPNAKGFFGKLIYDQLRSKRANGLHVTNPAGLQSWYARDSLDNLRNVVIPALERDKIVLCDRFRPSLVHSAQRAEDIPKLMDINRAIIGEHFIWPDVVFIFMVDSSVAIERLKSKSIELDIQETQDEITRTISMYRYFARTFFNSNCEIIDNNGDVEVTLNVVMARIKEVLLAKGFIFKEE